MSVVKVPGQVDTEGPRSVRRALQVLQVFRPGHDELSLSQIASDCGLASSTAFRLCRALVHEGFLVQDPHSGRYALGSAALTLGQLAEETFGLDRAREILSRLPDAPVETIKLGVADGDTASILIRVWVDRRLHFDRPAGSRRFPLHASAMGKALLAFMPDREARIALLGPLESFSPRTITDVDELRKEVAVVRRRGFAIGSEEWKAGVTCVAAPVFDGSGRATAAIAAGLPARATHVAPIESYGPVVIRIARLLSEVFCARSWPVVSN